MPVIDRLYRTVISVDNQMDNCTFKISKDTYFVNLENNNSNIFLRKVFPYRIILRNSIHLIEDSCHEEIYNWCKMNLGYNFRYDKFMDGYMLYSNSKTDSLLFALRWC